MKKTKWTAQGGWPIYDKHAERDSDGRDLSSRARRAERIPRLQSRPGMSPDSTGVKEEDEDLEEERTRKSRRIPEETVKEEILGAMDMTETKTKVLTCEMCGDSYDCEEGLAEIAPANRVCWECWDYECEHGSACEYV